MPKTKISEYSATANSNTDVASINIDEGCAPSGINNAIRAVMGHLKDFQQGTNGDPFNGPVNGTVGATTANTGAFTTLTTTGTINLITVGRGAGAVSTNTAVGASALFSNTTNGQNTALGYNAGYYSTGSANSYIGYNAGPVITSGASGSYNTALGASALANNTTASNNTAVGYQAAYSNTATAGVTAFGAQAGYSSTVVVDAFGYQSLYANTVGLRNASFGIYSLFANTTGSSNNAFGRASLGSNTTGSGNTAFGDAALTANTTASSNTAVGYQALYSNQTGAANTSFGYLSGYSSTGGANAFFGYYSGNAATTGTNNSFFGTTSGYLVTTGAKNTIIGCYSGNQGGLDIRTSNNYIVLSDGDGNPRGYFSSDTFSINYTGRYSQLGFYNTSSQKAAIWWDNTNLVLQTYTNANGPYLSNGGTSWTNSSDERLKNITGEIQNGLSKVCTLRAAEYTWKADAEAKPKVGLIAQDVLAVLPEAVTTSTIKGDETNTEYLGVAYTETIPLLVAAIKELKAEVDSLKAQINGASA